MQGRCFICRKFFAIKRFKGLQLSPMLCSVKCFEKYLKAIRKIKSPLPTGEWDISLVEKIVSNKIKVTGNMKMGEFRSKPEEVFAKLMKANNIKCLFEPFQFSMKIKGIDRYYLPDFYLPNYGIFIEIKDTIWEAGAYPKYKIFSVNIPVLLITKPLITAWKKNDK